MIPILYYGTETSFTSNGLGRLNDIIECTVTEERNSIYECEFTYPITGKFYQLMVTMVEAYSTGDYTRSGIIACIHDDKHDIQPFDLYSVSSPIDGVVTFNAHHISYRTNDEILFPFDASSVAQVFAGIDSYIQGGSAFTFWTDKTTVGNFEITTPHNVREILGGSEGSILDIYGSGEYEFDKFSIKLYGRRGIDSGITIRYGKNLTDIERNLDSSDTYNAVAPFWDSTVSYEDGSTEDVVVTLDELTVKSSAVTGSQKARPLDLTSEFEEMPTQAQLRARAVQYLENNEPWVPKDNVRVSFVQLWQTEEYANVAILQRLSLCDTVSVYYPALGIIANKQKVTRVVYNVMLERYDEMEIGSSSASLSDTISDSIRADYEDDLNKVKKNAVNDSMLQAAISHATELISGGLGGHVVFTLNADGEPEEILIMDTDDVNTAVNVWRFNQGGLGHSHTGYNGPFSDVALTMDGAINANMITAGQLNANIIKTGIIQDQKQYNYWNMATGEFQLKAYATTSYTDTQVTGAKTYADTKTSAALSSAKTYADGKISDYDTNLNQAKVFNKLTNNGALKGIYMKNNKLYINASYIYSGTLKLGGNNNENGLLQVLDADGNIAILANKDGMTFDSEVWYAYSYTNNTTGVTTYANGDSVLENGPNNTSLSAYLNQGNNYYKKRATINNGELHFYRRIVTKNKKVLSIPIIETAGRISSLPNGLYIYSGENDTGGMLTDQGVYIKGYSAALSVGGKYTAYGNRTIANNMVAVEGSLYVGNYGSLYMTYDNGIPRENSEVWRINATYGHLQIHCYEMRDGTATAETLAFEFSNTGRFDCNKLVVNSVDVTNIKAKLVTTEDYGKRRLYCYETPTPSFGDIGEGTIDETGYCYVYLEPIFAETISNDVEYQVFLQNYGAGNSYVYSKSSNYFVVKGDPGLHFAWEIKAKQLGYSQYRLEKREDEELDINGLDYGKSAADYIDSLTEGRIEE